MVVGAAAVMLSSFIIILEQCWRNQGARDADLEGASPKAPGPMASVMVACVSTAIILSLFCGFLRSSSVIIKTGSGQWL